MHIHKQMRYQQCFSFCARVLFRPSRLLSSLHDLDNPTTTITLPEAVYKHIHIYFYIVSLLTHIRIIYLTDDFFFLPTTGEISLSFVWVYLPVNERGIRYDFRGPYAIITQYTYVYKIHYTAIVTHGNFFFFSRVFFSATAANAASLSLSLSLSSTSHHPLSLFTSSPSPLSHSRSLSHSDTARTRTRRPRGR